MDKQTRLQSEAKLGLTRSALAALSERARANSGYTFSDAQEAASLFLEAQRLLAQLRAPVQNQAKSNNAKTNKQPFKDKVIDANQSQGRIANKEEKKKARGSKSRRNGWSTPRGRGVGLYSLGNSLRFWH